MCSGQRRTCHFLILDSLQMWSSTLTYFIIFYNFNKTNWISFCIGHMSVSGFSFSHDHRYFINSKVVLSLYAGPGMLVETMAGKSGCLHGLKQVCSLQVRLQYFRLLKFVSARLRVRYLSLPGRTALLFDTMSKIAPWITSASRCVYHILNLCIKQRYILL